MKVFRSAGEIPPDFGPSAVAIGNFDGLHIGHRRIIRQLVQTGPAATVLTFDPHPAQVLAPERAPKLLMTMQQRLRAFEQAGVDAVYLLPFSLNFAAQSPEEFARDVLCGTLKAAFVLVGEDFRFGYRQSGSIDTLRELGARYGFEVIAATGISRRNERVSSTAIRKLVVDGAVSRACRMLGTPFALEGEVVRGHGIGSTQTVPTLNLAPRNAVLPARGVYVTRTRDLGAERVWPSITNIGYRPTFAGEDLTVETFLLEPIEGPAPVAIELELLSRVRDEKKFDSPAELRVQILRDARIATRLHQRLNRLRVRS